MRWSFRLMTVAGIGLYIHVTFFLLLLWIGAMYYLPRHSLPDTFDGLVFVIAVFVIIVLHELGHALTARRFGIRTRDITLLPIGGVARLERMPEDPRQELAVALAGPAVNVALAFIFFVALVILGQPIIAMDWGDPSIVGANFLRRLLMVNVILAGFNLLPAFPMDGGRVLRAVLAMKMDYIRATHVAANIGQVMAFIFGFVGLFTYPLLIFVALFVWMGAAAESSMVQMKAGLGGIPVSRVMITDFKTLTPEEPLGQAADHLLAGYQQDFPVVDGDEKILGMLTRARLVDGLAKNGETTLVGNVMETKFVEAHPSEMAEAAFIRLQQHSECRSMPVLRDGKLLGIVTAENVGEFLMIQAALHGEPYARAA